MKKLSKIVGISIELSKAFVEVAKPNLATFFKFAKVELVPPTPGEFPKVMHGIKDILQSAKTGKWKELTVREAWLNTLVAVEVGCWFFVGECIGKLQFVGYSTDV